MAMKECFQKMQPVQLYVILMLTIAFFIVELVLSHVTHALTLLMDSYHMLCNIMALSGCIITIKYGKDAQPANCNPDIQKTQSVASSIGEELTSNPIKCHDKKKTKPSITRESQAKKLKNTFGWARIDVIVMLICCVFLASCCFSIFVEALQTLVHIDHQDEMHHPIFVLCTGGAGLVLNAICYLLIGGYTFHQGSFLHVTESGDVVLNKVVVDQSVQMGGRRLSRTRSIYSTIMPPKSRQGLWEMTRDIHGCVLVIICALMIFFADKETAKYIDPIISLISVIMIIFLSYPYIKESCLILLQTIPDTIDIDILKKELLSHFPDIVNVHDFHVWQLTANKVITTVHIIFQNPKVYNKIMEEVKEFFINNGITQVTIQPEFYKPNTSTESLVSNKFASCLMRCQGEICNQNHCCPDIQEKKIFKSSLKDILTGNQTPDLKSVKILDDELSIRTISSENDDEAKQKASKQNEANYNEINKSLNEIRGEQEAVRNKIIAENESKIEQKVDKVLNMKDHKNNESDVADEEVKTLNEEKNSESNRATKDINEDSDSTNLRDS